MLNFFQHIFVLVEVIFQRTEVIYGIVARQLGLLREKILHAKTGCIELGRVKMLLHLGLDKNKLYINLLANLEKLLHIFLGSHQAAIDTYANTINTRILSTTYTDSIKHIHIADKRIGVIDAEHDVVNEFLKRSGFLTLLVPCVVILCVNLKGLLETVIITLKYWFHIM